MRAAQPRPKSRGLTLGAGPFTDSVCGGNSKDVKLRRHDGSCAQAAARCVGTKRAAVRGSAIATGGGSYSARQRGGRRAAVARWRRLRAPSRSRSAAGRESRTLHAQGLASGRARPPQRLPRSRARPRTKGDPRRCGPRLVLGTIRCRGEGKAASFARHRRRRGPAPPGEAGYGTRFAAATARADRRGEARDRSRAARAIRKSAGAARRHDGVLGARDAAQARARR